MAPEDDPKLLANVVAHQALLVQTAVVSGAKLAEIEPLIRTGDGAVAAFETGSGHADPNGTLSRLVELGCTPGTTIVRGTSSG